MFVASEGRNSVKVKPGGERKSTPLIHKIQMILKILMILVGSMKTLLLR